MLNHIRLTRALLRNPKNVGAVVPSSRFLANQMAGLLPVDSKAVVEFGGGTGPVTRAILEAGCPPENLYVFELSEQLCSHLRGTFPDIHVMNMSAAEIMSLDCEVGRIISSLPFKSMPAALVADILEASRNKLQPGGFFVQFTYDLGRYNTQFDDGFRHLSKKIVWANLPPARIDLFQKA